MALLGGLEILLIKGIGSIAAHITTTGLYAAVKILAHYVLAHGAIAAAAALTPIAVYAAITVGGIVWTKEKIDYVNKITKAIANNDPEEAGRNLLKLRDILGLAIDETAAKVVEFLDDQIRKRRC